MEELSSLSLALRFGHSPWREPSISRGELGEGGSRDPPGAGLLCGASPFPLLSEASSLCAGAPGAVGVVPDWSQAAPGGDPSPAHSLLSPPTS